MTIPIRLTDEETRRLVDSHTALIDAANTLLRSLPWGVINGAGLDIDSEPIALALSDAAVIAQDIDLAERRALAELTTKENTHA